MAPTASNRFSQFARFMGLRQCPACDEVLFAAETAQFVNGNRIKLRWCCDACGHTFHTDIDSRDGKTWPIAA